MSLASATSWKAQCGGARAECESRSLIEAKTGAHLWADRFDGVLDDVFDLQDQVASSVAGVIEPALHMAEAARSARRPTNDLSAYDAYLRALPMILSSADRIPEAVRLLDAAIARDPNYGPALAIAAICSVRLVADNHSDDPTAERKKAAEYARKALALQNDDPLVLANAAFALAYLGEDINAMKAMVDRALALNPNYARGWHISGYIRGLSGDTEASIEHLETALRLSPRAPVGTTTVMLGTAYFMQRRFGDALPKLPFAVQEDPTHTFPYRVLAACYAHMNRLEEAKCVVQRLAAITPVIIPDLTHARNPEQRELLASGLRLAMGEVE